ncbi:NADH-quinone oxidoreductase subunit C [Desulfothermus okinawensis JCM 13304]
MKSINIDILSDFKIDINVDGDKVEIESTMENNPQLLNTLFNNNELPFAGIVLDTKDKNWIIYYIFLSKGKKIIITTKMPIIEKTFKSVSTYIHGADWFERELEDLFGINFEGHPKLGDFILHDDIWPEDVEPMRPDFDLSSIVPLYRKDIGTKRIVKEKGSFIMPIGPIFSGEEESVHFRLETIGEEIIKCHPRLFYKYRAIEKKAENKPVYQVLLLSERICGKTAVSHSLAFCLAVEEICQIKIPERASFLRMYLAELERIRHHIEVIGRICNSTGLLVAENQVSILEEGLLRISQELTGHRYLFSINQIGGLSWDIKDELIIEKTKEIGKILKELGKIKKMLISTSTFLDRLEQVGVLDISSVKDYAMVGPVARATGYNNDVRKYIPYLEYRDMEFDVSLEKEGDGYARLRIFFSEIEQSYNIMEQIVKKLPEGKVNTNVQLKRGSGIGIVEGPKGLCVQFVRIEDGGKIGRYRVISPSFFNWHGYHLAVEGFAFQDFPIILATFGLSAADNDR